VEGGIRREAGGRIFLRNIDSHLPNHIPDDRNLYIQYLQNLKTIMKTQRVKDDEI
jgi:hypothetical protein